jgi:hypothetical protein
MNNRDAALLTFRTFSIYAFFRGVEEAAWLPYRWNRAQPPAVASSMKVPTIVYLNLFPPLLLFLIFAIVLWLVAPRLSNSLFTGDSHETERHTLGIGEIQSILFLAVGLFILVNTIPSVIDIVFIFYAALTSSMSPSSHGQASAMVIAAVLKISLGLWLVFGSRGLSNILSKIRNE